MLALAVGMACVPARLMAHAGAPPSPHDLWRSWGLAPAVLVPLYLTAWLYTRGVEAVWRRAGRGRGIRPAQAAAFAAGFLALAVAMVSPVDRVAESLFWVHMTQHLLLMAVAAPLLVLGAPQAGLAWGLPRPARRRVARWWHALPRLRVAIAWLVRPWPAVALHSIALWAWHLPGAYDAAVARPWVHALEHASFLGTALLFWWAVLHPRGSLRRVPGLAILALFGITMQGGALGALLTFSTAPWYASHLATARAWGLAPLEDQQIAGLVMWVPGSLAYLAAAAWLFIAWMARSERRDMIAEARPLAVNRG
ncbi:MAG TPA: cytochrome c oxidase assembly protein [Longimicrobium sp.]